MTASMMSRKKVTYVGDLRVVLLAAELLVVELVRKGIRMEKKGVLEGKNDQGKMEELLICLPSWWR